MEQPQKSGYFESKFPGFVVPISSNLERWSAEFNSKSEVALNSESRSYNSGH